jgi:L-iditol 2-dehydrogenase
VLHGFDACGLDEPRDVLVIGAGPIGLLFVNVLTIEGHRVTLADPNPSRLEAGRAMGAARAALADRSAGGAEALCALAEGENGFDLVIEATGSPAAWATAMDCVRTGGEVLLFGGCAPGTSVPLDTHRAHYSELTLRGAYHHRPATFARAVELLGSGRINAGPILSGTCGLDGVEDALRKMGRREALKYVVAP